MIKGSVKYKMAMANTACLYIIVGLTALLLVGCDDSDINLPGETPKSELTVEMRLQTLLNDSVTTSDTPGAVMLIETPTRQWVGASGLANTALKTLMQPTDLLRIGSMTKPFVAVTVLKLIEEGKLCLDGKIRYILPDIVTGRITNGSEITLRQLLDMTSGIYDYTESDAYNDSVENNPNRPKWGAEEVLEFSYDADADFYPGTGWQYSNTNYILLEMIIAKVSGSSLASEMHRVIHSPLGLKNTFMEIREARDGGFGGLLVRGYDEGEDITEINDALGLGDGGLISDAKGLAQFLRGLLKDKTILSQASLNQMLEFHPTEDYGLGISKTQTDFGIAWEHDGSTAGFEGSMVYLPEKEIIFVLLTNDFNSKLMDSLYKKAIGIIIEQH